MAIIFLCGYSGIFKVADKKNKFYFGKSTTDISGYIQFVFPKGPTKSKI